MRVVACLTALLFCGCSNLGFRGASPYGDPGGYLAFTVPLGATDTTRTTGPAARADELDTQIQRLWEHRMSAEVQADPLRVSAVSAEINRLTRIRDALLAEAEGGQEDATTEKTAGEHLQLMFGDYRNFFEGVKTTGWQSGALAIILMAGNAADVWRIEELPFAREIGDGSGELQLKQAEALQASAERDKDTTRVDGSGNTVILQRGESFEDTDGGRATTTDVRGENNLVIITTGDQPRQSASE